jgi:hypothetical protein
MKNTVIIIPTRLAAARFPNKPLAKINNMPMILHVLNKARKSKVGEVFNTWRIIGMLLILAKGLFGNLAAASLVGIIITVFFIKWENYASKSPFFY